MAGKTGGVLNIGTAAAASIEVLPEAIFFFRARYPQAEIFVHGGLPLKLLPRLLDGSIDLLIGPRPGIALPPSVHATALFVSQNAIVVRKGHPLQRARSFQEFADAKWVLTSELSMPDSCLGLVHAACKMPPPAVVLHTDDPFLTERLVARTDYVTVLRKCFFQSALVSADVVPVELSAVDLSDEFAMLTRKAGQTPFLAERFIEILQTHASARVHT
jgi:LysR family transcriptional regulator, regulator of abg operon